MLRKSREKLPYRRSSGALPSKNLGRKDGLVRVVRRKVAVAKSVEPQDVGQLPARGRAPGPDAARNLTNRPALDWSQAVCAATSRLKEKLNIVGGGDVPQLREMAEDLAVLICAYGRLAEEVERMMAREENAGKVQNPS
ncbi:hypothetical protein [Rhodoblastus sp.]|uniref:hypothetical protein n=1 Tax=Rhodoblastus sp. TaxID=1962975 RepID=UPI003F957828